MRAFLWRHQFQLSVLSLLLAVCGFVTLLTSHQTAGYLCIAGYTVVAAAREIIGWRCKPPSPTLTPEEEATLRAERAGEGETAAVRMLRAAYPDMGLLEAAARVRTL